MKQRLKMPLMVACLCLMGAGTANAQWVVSDPGNLAQSIINSAKEMVETAGTKANTLNGFLETKKVFEQGKAYYARAGCGFLHFFPYLAPGRRSPYGRMHRNERGKFEGHDCMAGSFQTSPLYSAPRQGIFAPAQSLGAAVIFSESAFAGTPVPPPRDGQGCG